MRGQTAQRREERGINDAFQDDVWGNGLQRHLMQQGVLRRRGMLLREKVFYFVSVMLALNYSLKFE